MQTICLTNRKGGVGKTTATQQIGAGLTRLGYKVLFIDLDSQHNLTDSVGAEINDRNIVEVLQGNMKAADAIQHTEQGDIIPAVSTLANIDDLNSNTLRGVLKPLQQDYSFCLIDTPSQLGAVTVNALTASDSVIIPATPEHLALKGIVTVSKVIKAVQEKTNPGLKIKGILMNMYGGRSNIEKAMLENCEDLAKQLNTKVFKSTIRKNIALSEASFFEKDIFSYSIRSKGAVDFASLINEILKDV